MVSGLLKDWAPPGWNLDSTVTFKDPISKHSHRLSCWESGLQQRNMRDRIQPVKDSCLSYMVTWGKAPTAAYLGTGIPV